LYLAYTSDNKLIVDRFKRGFFCGVCIEKGARSFVGENLKKLECGPMPNVMVALALPNIGGALCSTPQSLADVH